MRDRFVEAIASATLIGCLAAAGVLMPSITRQRQELQLVISTEGTRGMPPHVALATAALGTFRGLAVDFLWVRADALQDKGEFFEAQTLSQWITALQPRFPKVWGFQAWNLAYNISVSTKEPAERWVWINRGINLLRLQGIPLNPGDANLPMELGWLFFHKIGGKNDREHWYYKARLAREFREFLGDTTGGRTSAQAVERFRKIADAPESLDAMRADPLVRDALLLLEKHAATPNEDFLRMMGRVVLYNSSIDTKLLAGKVLPSGTNRGLVSALIEDQRLATAVFDTIIPHLQKRVLADRYCMEPRFMLELLQKYGPLDWAHPHAHGIYWSEKGIAVGRKVLRRDRLNELTIIRTRLGNLQHLMRSGRLEFDPLADRIDILPDPRFIEAYEQGMQDAIRLIQSDAGVSAGEFGLATVEDLLTGYESFLQQATVFSYLYGDDREAAGCFGKLRTLAEESGKPDQPLYNEGLDGFLMLRLGEVMEIDISNTRQFLDAMIQRAMLDGLAAGRIDTFNRFLKLAYTVYDKRYGVSAPGTMHVNKEAQLPPFPRIVDVSFRSAMKQESSPVLIRARIWAWAPDELKARNWAQLGETLTAQAKAEGLDPARAFPQPPDTEKTGEQSNKSPQNEKTAEGKPS